MKKIVSIIIFLAGLIFIYSCNNDSSTIVNTTNTGPPNFPGHPFPPADTTLHPGYHVSFSWTGGSHTLSDTIRYDIYLDTFTPPTTLLAGDLKTENIDWGIPAIGSYYWRVVAKNQRGETSTGTNWHFYVDTVTHSGP